jgi:hypothetical protein
MVVREEERANRLLLSTPDDGEHSAARQARSLARRPQQKKLTRTSAYTAWAALSRCTTA